MAATTDRLADEGITSLREALRRAMVKGYHGTVGIVFNILDGKLTYYEHPVNQTRHVRDIEREANERHRDSAKAG